MAFMDFLFGKGAKTKTEPIYEPGGEQENVLNQLLGALQQQLPAGLKGLENILGGREETFQQFAAPARRGFEEQTLPSIAERFTGTFGPGSQRSAAFGQQLGQAGKALEEDIFSQRLGLQSGALQNLMSLLGPATAPREYKAFMPRESGFLENILTSLLGGGLSFGGKKS